MTNLDTITAPAPDQADPAKRRQILDGATRAFLSLGFNGASMGEIARVAGVSKGTLYAYFQSKEQLFEACIDEKRATKFQNLLQFDLEKPVEEELHRYGTQLATFLTGPEAIMAMRTVIGIAEQMPELGQRFYALGPARSAKLVAEFLQKKCERGEIDLPDPELAAVQFADMCQSTLIRPLLFGCTFTEDELSNRIRSVVANAVTTFMRAYGTGPTRIA